MGHVCSSQVYVMKVGSLINEIKVILGDLKWF